MNNPSDRKPHSGRSASHIAVEISSHGYGHAAMTAPLINHLQSRHPALKVTLRTAVPLAFLKSKFKGPFNHQPQSCDVGMLMNGAFAVDRSATLRAYRDLHADWPARIDEERKALTALNPDLVISNIAYLPLIAAREAGIPAIAIGCLNWAEIFSHYYPEEQAIQQQILDAYRSAKLFIRTEPAMPMDGLDTQRVGPLIDKGKKVREALLARLGLTEEAKIILVSMGGIKTELSAEHWPRLEHAHYIAATPVDNANRPDVTHFEELGLDYNDLLRACDLLLTKPGYGNFTEAALNTTPVLYVNRDEWPEQPYLTAWLQRHVPCNEITQKQFRLGRFNDEMGQLLQRPRSSTPPHTGIAEATGLIEQLPETAPN